MRAKKLGRHELLSWVNGIAQSDYTKIENLSDGVGFIQVLDAFQVRGVELTKVKFNSKNAEDWEKNFAYINELLSKAKSHKQVDPIKMSKGKFVTNFEFLQFLYDFVLKSFGDNRPQYKAYERRLEAVRATHGAKADVKKYLPSHLIPNEMILKMEKQKYYSKSSEDNGKAQAAPENQIPEKYKDFLNIIKDDLRKMVDSNLAMNEEVNGIEEERQYYLNLIDKVYKFCQDKLKGEIKNAELLRDIQEIIKQVPEDFK